jgi:electron transfer flavoprotein alpha subunit
VAVNKDRNAPIFALADYGVVADVHEFLPAFTAAVKEAKGG